MTFAWSLRLKYGVLAALAGWLTGWLVTIPFKVTFAWRYVDGHANQLPESLAKGLLVWAAFSLFMAVAGFLPLALPLFLLISPQWMVRWRWVVIPGATLAAILALTRRMGLLNIYYFRHPQVISDFFFSAPNLFVIVFTLVMVWVYVRLAKRRLSVSSRLL
jgi:hypothetical protein